MKTKQAKDFLVLETTQQAARENIPLSDIEKKMMYFRESDATSCDNPSELNDKFEAQHNTAEYEAKGFTPAPPCLQQVECGRPRGIGTKPFARFAKVTTTFWFCGTASRQVSILSAIPSSYWALGCSSQRAYLSWLSWQRNTILTSTDSASIYLPRVRVWR
jgi:hypothetical protein